MVWEESHEKERGIVFVDSVQVVSDYETSNCTQLT